MKTPFKNPIAPKQKKSFRDFVAPSADEFKQADGYGMGDDYGVGVRVKIGTERPSVSSDGEMPKGAMKIKPKTLA